MWGSNARETHPIFFHHVLVARERGARIFVVDPRRTATADWAERWLGLRVGTDIALALAVGREIIHAGLVNTTFVERATSGFAEYTASAEEWTLERAEAVTGVAADDIATLAHAYLILHLVHAQLGSPERAAYRGIALPLYEDLGDLRGQASALNNLGIEAYYEGDWVKAADLYERSRKLHERIGDATHVGMTTNNIGEILSDQGRLDEAASLFATVVADCDTIGHRALAGVAQANLGRVAARAGRFEEAEEILESALEVLRETGAGAFVKEAEARLAELDTLRGDRPQEAIERLDLSGAVREGAGGGLFEAMVQRVRAAALLQLGDREPALAALQASVTAARAADARFELALSLDLLGRACEDGAASEESARLFEQLGVEQVARPPLA